MFPSSSSRPIGSSSRPPSPAGSGPSSSSSNPVSSVVEASRSPEYQQLLSTVQVYGPAPGSLEMLRAEKGAAEVSVNSGVYVVFRNPDVESRCRLHGVYSTCNGNVLRDYHECFRVGAISRCFCGHEFAAHHKKSKVKREDEEVKETVKGRCEGSYPISSSEREEGEKKEGEDSPPPILLHDVVHPPKSGEGGMSSSSSTSSRGMTEARGKKASASAVAAAASSLSSKSSPSRKKKAVKNMPMASSSLTMVQGRGGGGGGRGSSSSSSSCSVRELKEFGSLPPCSLCNCKQFSYMHSRPEEIAEAWLSARANFDVTKWRAKCKCKHFHTDHHAVPPYRCRSCGCSAFHSAFECLICDGKWEDHETFVETEKERKSLGFPTGEDFIPFAELPDMYEAVFGEAR